jgi:amino acid adenylation domain-containing protein
MQEVITEKEIRQGFRLSPQQQWLWRQQQSPPVFRAVSAIVINGGVDVSILRDALDRVVQRHEICRTSFHRRAELRFPVQVINERAEPFWQAVDLREHDPAEQETQIEEIFSHEKSQPLELERESLLRVTLLTLSNEQSILIVNLPALCADARTLQNLVGELAESYAACLRNEDTSAEVTQYIQFSEWLHELLVDDDAAAGKQYWNRLASVPPLKLPLENRTAPEFVPAVFAFEVGLSQSGTVDAVFLLACWQVLLSRLTGNLEIVSTNLHEGRNDEELRDAFGPFARRLLLVAQLSPDQTFSDVLRQVRDAVDEAEQWQDYFVSHAGDNRYAVEDCSAFAFEFEQRVASVVASGLTFATYKQYVCDGPFKVKLSCAQGDGRLNLELHYDENLFARNDIARLAEEYQTLLSAAVADPEARLSDLAIVGPAEQRLIVSTFNNTAVDYPTDKALHELFEASVESAPTATAIEFKEQRLSYAELNARANQLAHYLRHLGVGPDVLVGVLMERSVEMAIGLLAILKAGGAYVPLDPEYPAERLRFMIDDAGVPVLLTQSRLLAALPEHVARVVCVDTDWNVISPQPTDNLTTGVTAGNLAYVIYTSGSTGQPKGAMVHHGGVINCLRWMQQTYKLDHTDKFVLKTSLNFDPSVWELFWPLWVGAGVCIVPPGDQLDNAYLINLIKERACTAVYFVPSALRIFLEEREVEQCRSLKYVICGGEALPMETVARFYELLPAELHHSYGPTETSIAASEWTCEANTRRGVVPMGFPLANTQTYVLDQNLNLAPIGVIGELYIGGHGLGRGYLHRTELTADRFIPDPLSSVPGARLYRTGDLVRQLPDGSLEFAGRVDHQVKIRGFRIELGEIESQLRKHPAIKETVVVAREDKPGEKRLVAYLVAAPEQHIAIDEVREFVKSRLPEYMVPAAFVILEALPVMHNGKVDRRQLPEPEQLHPETELIAPRTIIEELLTVVWKELLGIEQISVHHNFFELGGHSLLGTQLIGRLRKLFRVELPLRLLFDSPTIAGMAAAVETLLREGQAAKPPLLPLPRNTQLPLSFAQQRLWFLDQLQPGSPFYNLYSAVRLEGELDISALEQSFDEIVKRHESLRTIFPNVNGKPVQLILPSLKLTLESKDLRALPEVEREAEVRRLATEEVQRPFDLSRGPLLRLTLLHTGEQDHILVFCIHHIISDGWSSSVLIRELVTCYQSLLMQQRPQLPDLPVQYADFARWQREWLQGEVLQTQLDYWRKQLAGAPPVLELPIAKPRPAVQTFRGARELHLFSPATAAAIDKLSRQERVTPFMVLLAAFQVLLSRYTGQDDIVVGTPIAGRDQVEAEGLIGFFVNTLVLRTDLAGNPSFKELLGRVREVALGAAAHQDLPFEKLVEELQPERDLSRTPLFQTMFALQNIPQDSYSLPNLMLSPLTADTGAAKFDLTMFFNPTGEGLLGILEYNTDLYDAESITRMWLHFETLLKRLLAAPEQNILSLPLLSESERRQLLEEWNDTVRDFPQDACAHQLFEAQVQRTPSAIAVESDEASLTYDELNLQANRLARSLVAKGVGPETLVAVLAQRGIPLLTAMLGIFKAGGVYLPLDPRHPVTRHVQVLQQSGAAAVLVAEELESVAAAISEQMLSSDTAVQLLPLELSHEAEDETEDLPTRGGPRNLAYVIFTSGSTGVPKGSMIEHRGMINHLFIKARDLEMTSADIVAQTASQCFDISVWQFLAPLLVGGRVRVFDDEVVADPKALLHALEKESITVVETVPSLLRATLAEMQASLGTPLRALRWMVATGEALAPEICEAWQHEVGESVRLLNAYGPTECSDDVTHYEVKRTVPVVRVPIGRALSNTKLYICDRELGLVPVGVNGELCVGGAGVGRGYLYDAARTATSFVPDPFADHAGARLYRTGDLCRYLPDGNIEFLGRIDDQVKVRGFRIELGEIETVLSTHTEVKQVAIVVREDTEGDKRLVAYVVPSQSTLISDDLREYLKGQLPDYMIPQVFVTLDALPLTPNGKLDRRSLPSPDYSQQTRGKAYQAPRTTTETIVAEIWSEVLGQQSIGVEDNFFSVGGHSLLATQVVSRVRQRFEIELPLRVMFESPTIAELSTAIERERAQQTRTETPALTRRSRREPDLNELLARVQNLSDAEARETLQSKKDTKHAAAQ